ncbi:hypothetical protein [Butyrivibrio sp. WCE2006]|uniref:hypothetical protein n=1 Tax=Butyrivibrio sp. WCE2006 TaxID=1410611 RepID=UPI0012DE24DA
MDTVAVLSPNASATSTILTLFMKGMDALIQGYPRKDHRHGIIHDCLPTEEGMKICHDYNIQLPMVRGKYKAL